MKKLINLSMVAMTVPVQIFEKKEFKKKHKEMKLGIVGSRCFGREEVVVMISPLIDNFIRSLMCKVTMIVSGAAKGIDTIAREYANSHSIPLKEHPPKTLTSYELLARNTLIVEDSEHLLAFVCPCSRGTWDTIRKARKKKIPVKVISLPCPEKKK